MLKSQKDWIGSIVVHADGDPGIVFASVEDSWDIKFFTGSEGIFSPESLHDPDTFVWIPLTPDPKFVECSVAVKLPFLESVISFLRIGDLDGADAAYFERCVAWWARTNYDACRSVFEAKLRKSEREKIRTEILGLLDSGDIDQADDAYIRRCPDWWNRPDYDRRRNRAIAFTELRVCLSDDYIAVDSLYENRFSTALTKAEYFELKSDFVRTWLQTNLPISPDQFPDDEQIAAIAAVTGTIQVTARAGSGKTTTLIRRTYFLMRHCRVPPEQILLLAFNRAAALDVRQKLLVILCPDAESTVTNEMRTRESSIKKTLDRKVGAVESAIRIHNVAMPNVMTFHALAYGVVNPEESLLIDSGEESNFGLSRTIQDVVDEHLRDEQWRLCIRSLMLAHFRNAWEQIERGGFDLRDRASSITYRRSLQRETLRGEYVKSYGEKLIANFLLEHGVLYKYERNHRWNGFNYRPDFTLFRQAGKNASGAIIEYFGLQGEPGYDEQSERKRVYWSGEPNWDFVEFTSADIAKEGSEGFADRLRAALIPLGFPCVRLSEDELWEQVRHRAIDRFTKAIVSFIGRSRKLLVTPEKLDVLRETHHSETDAEAMFLPVVRHFYAKYLEVLAISDKDDFDGVMQRAIAVLQSGHTLVRRGHEVVCDLSRIRFLSVDEFQDFSELFYQLVQRIRQSGGGVHCFCVGDDWQAINGFAGSDLKYFQEFSKYMGASSQLAITTNYRSTHAIVAAGNAVMAEHGKPARARPVAIEGSVLVANMDEFDATLLEQKNHEGDDITPAVLRIAARFLEAGRTVVVLCRTNTIPWYVNWAGTKGGLQAYTERLRAFLPEDRRGQISVSTTHKFKGLERDDVIIIDAVSRSYPLVHPDWVFSRILGVTEDQIIEEEQRLFYVAITRAKGSAILFTEKEDESPFLTNLKDQTTVARIRWSKYPPCDAASEYVVVRVTSRSGCCIANEGGGFDVPTYVLRESLKLSGYKFKSGDEKAWEKAVSSHGFDIAMLYNELWIREASGIDVTVRDGNSQVVGVWTVDEGVFHAEKF